jgi:hypothetical protein
MSSVHACRRSCSASRLVSVRAASVALALLRLASAWDSAAAAVMRACSAAFLSAASASSSCASALSLEASAASQFTRAS